MKKRKDNKYKKSILLSTLLAIGLVGLLIGATYAWFSDSVSSKVNRIEAGNLDVSLKHKVGDSFEEVKEDTELFDITLWEPGAIAYESFEIANLGNLALRYEFIMNVSKFNTVNGSGKSLKDVLKVAIYDGEFNGNRDDLKKLNLDYSQNIKTFVKENALNEKDAKDNFTIVVYWEPSDADNDFNLNNGKTSDDGEPLHIELGVSLVATQKDYEEDSFGNDYDKVEYKTVSTPADFVAQINALGEGEGVKLSSDIQLTTTIPKSNTGSTIINLDGHTLSSTSTYSNTINANEELVIRNGKLKLQAGGTTSAVLSPQNGGAVVLENVEFTVSKGVAVFPVGQDSSVKVINSVINGSEHSMSISTNANIEANHNVKIDIINSTIKDLSPVLVNVPCQLNIEDSKIIGAMHGVVVRGGTAVIKNSIITNTVSDEDANGLVGYFDNRNWGSGNMVYLSALTIGNKAPGSYQYPSDVTLINTKVISTSLDGSAPILPAAYIIGNTGDGLGAKLKYDSASSFVGNVVKGNEYATVEEIG